VPFAPDGIDPHLQHALDADRPARQSDFCRFRRQAFWRWTADPAAYNGRPSDRQVYRSRNFTGETFERFSQRKGFNMLTDGCL
jgi:hypothetical protein